MIASPFQLAVLPCYHHNDLETFGNFFPIGHTLIHIPQIACTQLPKTNLRFLPLSSLHRNLLTTLYFRGSAIASLDSGSTLKGQDFMQRVHALGSFFPLHKTSENGLSGTNGASVIKEANLTLGPYSGVINRLFSPISRIPANTAACRCEIAPRRYFCIRSSGEMSVPVLNSMPIPALG